jgi:hypothetical protein
MAGELSKITITCSGKQYKAVNKEWKKWRQETFGKMTSHYPFFKWEHNDGISIVCEYDREMNALGEEITKEMRVIYTGPADHPILAQIKDLLVEKEDMNKKLKEIKAKWEYKISLEQQRGAPESWIRNMVKDRDAELAKAKTGT